MRRAPVVINVSPEENKPRDIHLGPRTIHGSASPLDFPNKITVELHDDDSRDDSRLIVRFAYSMAVGEEQQKKSSGDGVVLFLGSRSGRVFQIELAISDSAGLRLKDRRVEKVIGEHLNLLKEEAQSLSIERRPFRRIAHYELLSDLLPIILDATRRLRST